jgi:hypothetical protein
VKKTKGQKSRETVPLRSANMLKFNFCLVKLLLKKQVHILQKVPDTVVINDAEPHHLGAAPVSAVTLLQSSVAESHHVDAAPRKNIDGAPAPTLQYIKPII